jgi:phage terminase large subunit-like protein
MKTNAGPKAAADDSPLLLPNRRIRSKSFDDFCRKYVPIRSKTGPVPLKPRKWQREIVSKIFDDVSVRLAGLQISRGNGKTSLCAAIGLWDLFCGQYGANVVACAVDERQATILFDVARWMVENSPELASRAQVYKDKIVVPGRSSTLRVLPAEAKRLEGLDFSLCILDESGVASADTFEVLNDSQGKRETSTLLLIGTPGIDPDAPLARVREYNRATPGDVVWIEYSADDFKQHDWDCQHCLRLANPAYGDFLFASGVASSKPPKSTEARWRRVRLGQWVTGSGDGYLDKGPWDACAEPARVILPGSPVVLGLDGSRSDDATALVAVSIEARPIVQVLGLWEPRLHDADYRVPVLAVEDAIRSAADVYSVTEIAADPFGWSRTLEVLKDEGCSVVEFPNTRERVSPVVASFREAVFQREISHDGDPKLAAHVTNAVVVEWARGIIVSKPSPKSARKIDALMATLFAFSRAKYHAAQKPKNNRLLIF